jgi:uncharacterized protein (TIGR02231 family)
MLRSPARLHVAVLIFGLGATAAPAAEITATSRIESVTVFPSGAEVVRAAKVSLPQGEHAVVFGDLPAQAIPGSIRVDGKATGRLDIGSVDTRRVRLQRADSAALAAERKRIEDEIERAKDLKAGLQAQVDTAEAQRALISNLTELPKRPVPAAGQTSQRDDWSQILSLIGTGMADVQRVILETRIKIRENDRKIQDLERKLSSLAPAPEERTQVKVLVTAGAALDSDLTVTYQVPGASWTSLYDARLSTGTKAVAPKLTLTRRASIQQRTGEAWEDVRLALSTARPSASSAAPELNPITVDFEESRPPPPPRPMAMSPAPAARSVAPAGAASDEGARREKVAEEAVQRAQEQQAAVEASTFQAVFTTQGRQSVPNTGEMKRVFLSEDALDPLLVVQTAPRLDTKAYLYAKVTLPKAGAAYLPGQVSLFRDATFVGNGRLPQLSPGQEHELGFGVDDRVVVKHAVAEEKRGESGLISSTKSDQRNFRISVKNQHERAVQLSVRDQIPASLNQDIKVELTGRLQPTRRDIDDKRGVLAWESELKADEERVIEFGYRVTWPAAKQIQYGR